MYLKTSDLILPIKTFLLPQGVTTVGRSACLIWQIVMLGNFPDAISNGISVSDWNLSSDR